MVHINLNNVEDVVFFDAKLCKLLPEFKPLFDQWQVSKLHPELRPLGRRALVDFLAAVDESHSKIIESYFGQKVSVDSSVNCSLVTHLQCGVDALEQNLNGMSVEGYPAICREGDQVYISFWK